MKRAILTISAIFLLLLFINLLIGLANTALLAPWNHGARVLESPFKTLSGAVHIHSRHSDGSGWLSRIQQAARNTGLDFILLTDHNDTVLADSVSGSTEPVMLAGAELSLQAGHLLLYGGPRVRDGFREQDFGGQQALLDSMEQNSGFAIVAHPFHPKISWKDSISRRIAGIEVINADVEWRNDSPLKLLRAIFALPFYDHAMNSLLDMPHKELALLDSLSQRQPVAAIGSVDAHARIKLSKTMFWRFPSYEKNFRLVQTALVVPDSSTGDSTAVVEALKRGNTIAGYAAFGDLRQISIWLDSTDGPLPPGSVATPGEGPVLRVQTPAGYAVSVRLYQNGIRIRESNSNDIRWPVEKPGVYRVVVLQLRRQFPFLSRSEIAWAFSSPFYMHSPE
ncbi:MAG TPA: hypothetical protein ENJ29_09900 [Bacteroidetes bacterium]|nr:hypothetical protein [Bacteroidota bacterium]